MNIALVNELKVLFAAMGGYTFIRDNEIHYELAASKDKDYIVVEGATHGAIMSVVDELRTAGGERFQHGGIEPIVHEPPRPPGL